jgi:hypothetical protein
MIDVEPIWCAYLRRLRQSAETKLNLATDWLIDSDIVGLLPGGSGWGNQVDVM